MVRATSAAVGGSSAGRFDPVIHESVRLRICGLLANVSPLQFAAIRDTLGVSDATCSKHLKVLTESGYVKQTRRVGRENRHKVMWVSLTAAGRTAFAEHMAALAGIAGGMPTARPEPDEKI